MKISNGIEIFECAICGRKYSPENEKICAICQNNGLSEIDTLVFNEFVITKNSLENADLVELEQVNILKKAGYVIGFTINQAGVEIFEGLIFEKCLVGAMKTSILKWCNIECGLGTDIIIHERV